MSAPADDRGGAALWLRETLASAAFARAFSLTATGVIVFAVAITRTMGEAGYLAMLAVLSVIGFGMLVVRRRGIDFVALLPLTLLLFVAWAGVSALWSTNPQRTLGGALWLAVVAFLAIVVAQVRDTLQTVRVIGDVMRWALGVSLALEILSGIILDMPFGFLGIEGDIASGGPIQGIFGTRNLLGFVVVVAAVTFVIELRTRAIRPGLAWASLVVAGILGIFSASPTVLVLALVTLVAAGTVVLLRRVPDNRRALLQYGIAGGVLIGAVAIYVLRAPIVRALNAGDDFATRGQLWDVVLLYTRVKAVQGWGFFGGWPEASVMPFSSIDTLSGATHRSALNTFLDVQLQLGLFGLVIFGAMCALALLRSWIVAGNRRSVLYAWAPLLLVVVLTNSIFESFTLWGAGWFLLVLAVVRAGLIRSWRERLVAART